MILGRESDKVAVPLKFLIARGITHIVLEKIKEL